MGGEKKGSQKLTILEQGGGKTEKGGRGGPSSNPKRIGGKKLIASVFKKERGN